MTSMPNIVLSGAVLNSDNLGCVALTYSAVKMLNEVAERLGTEFSYTILELSYDKDRCEVSRRLMSDRLGAPLSSIEVIPMGSSMTTKAKIRHCLENRVMRSRVKNAIALFDLTAGDSFSDIYGMERLERYAEPMDFALGCSTPLILGPQTFGPFNSHEGRALARRVLDGALLSVARDELSAQCFEDVCGKSARVSTDLAFGLPFDVAAVELPCTDAPRVALNASGLLYDDSLENTVKAFELGANYREFVHRIIEGLLAEGWELHLVPHVGADVAVNRALCKRYPRVIDHPLAETPVDAKNLICHMDLLIGSRMHATIAALSSGTAVVPVAYSRKFGGLFGGLGYGHVVDLTVCGTDDAVSAVLEAARAREALATDAARARVAADAKLSVARDALAACLGDLLNR